MVIYIYINILYVVMSNGQIMVNQLSIAMFSIAMSMWIQPGYPGLGLIGGRLKDGVGQRSAHLGVWLVV